MVEEKWSAVRSYSLREIIAKETCANISKMPKMGSEAYDCVVYDESKFFVSVGY